MKILGRDTYEISIADECENQKIYVIRFKNDIIRETLKKNI